MVRIFARTMFVKNLTSMLSLVQEEKKCLYCTKLIRGRTDKKFCNDYCRNYFNNKQNATATGWQRSVQHAINKNRRILNELLPTEMEMVRIKKERLMNEGFQFRYVTHVRHLKKRSIYYHCYDYGYLMLEEDWCLIFRDSEI